MGYIYIIKNDINDNVYIGQTSRDIEVRWKEHVRHMDTVIDKAMHKYGIEHFWIEQIEECPDNELDNREKYWIKQYDSYIDGYNASTGGQDARVCTPKLQEVLDLWHQGLTVNRIVNKTQLNVETVRGYLNKSGIDHDMIRKRANMFIGQAKSVQVYQYDKDWHFIAEWPSILEAGRALGKERNNISRACKTGGMCLGYHWSYKKE